MRRLNLFEILFWFTLTFKCSLTVNFDEKFKIFDGLPDNAEMIKAALGEGEDTKLKDFALSMSENIPVVGDIIGILKNSAELLKGEDDIKSALANAISSTDERAEVNNALNTIKALLGSTRKQTNILFRQNKGNHYLISRNKDDNRPKVEIVHNNLATMLEFFKLRSFKKFPLVTARLLIDICTLIALFYPIERMINIGTDNMDKELPCDAYDLLLAYRPRTVFARTEKLNLKYLHYDLVCKKLAMPYNPRGYISPSSSTLRCKEGCQEPFSNKVCDNACSFSLPHWVLTTTCKTSCTNLGYERFGNCIDDSLDRSSSYTLGNSVGKKVTCEDDYLSHLRKRVESLFPVESLKKICHRGTQQKSGNYNKNQHTLWSRRRFVSRRLLFGMVFNCDSTYTSYFL